MKNIFVFLVLSIALSTQATSFATTGFQCYDAKTSGKKENHYLIFARLDYFQKSLPISSADMKVDGKWISISDRSVKSFSRSKNKMSATIEVSKNKKIQIQLVSTERDGIANGTLLTYTLSRDKKSSSIVTVKIKCLLDDTL